MTQASTHLTHWRNLSNPNYIGAYAFQPGEERVVTIESVGEETVIGVGGKKDDCMVLHLINEKPMIANKTNCKALAKLFGTPYIEQWIGKSFILHVQKVQASGETVEAIRVKAQLPQIPFCAKCKKRIEGIGKYTAYQVAAKSRERYGEELCAECAKENGTV